MSKITISSVRVKESSVEFDVSARKRATKRGEREVYDVSFISKVCMERAGEMGLEIDKLLHGTSLRNYGLNSFTFVFKLKEKEPVAKKTKKSKKSTQISKEVIDEPSD